MTTQLTVNQLEALLTTQKELDQTDQPIDLKDAQTAFTVQFFEWFNAFGEYKYWSTKPDRNTQLKALAKLLAHALTITNQRHTKPHHLDEIVNENNTETFENGLEFENQKYTVLFIHELPKMTYSRKIILPLHITFAIAKKYYSIGELINTYIKEVKQ